jgi:hypothetical protein
VHHRSADYTGDLAGSETGGGVNERAPSID